ncbi:unnamed protein product [Rotaria magnacalcarata]|uniref:Urocanate hydratase n=1 Tax=Rotaria magnacalcarata TaxID=392030 RepID=A0A8S2KXW4_9BILA|nr:unnamed protein product [Rotaria magnacalcarata]
MSNEMLNRICSGLPLNPLPPRKTVRNANVPHAPDIQSSLTNKERKLAIKNALRYFPSHIQGQLIDEFIYELDTYGHIYMYRFQPDIEMRAYPIDEYPCKCKAAAAIMLMIMNNLDRRVAQFPDELVTYGGNGQAFSNWAQFVLVMHYLSIMTDEQVLVMYSGHPMGLFPTRSDFSPRVVITNGLLSYDDARQLMKNDPKKFKELVHESIRRQIAAIDILYERGMYFFDYGNAFLLTAKDAGAPIGDSDDNHLIRFKYPSYVQDIMGDIFSLGFGPFRWVCASGLASDLKETDKIAGDIIKEQMSSKDIPANVLKQYYNNLKWIEEAEDAKLVVGSQARILYSDQMGRIKIGLAFNQAVRTGRLKGPVILSRDHHDVSGTDSPFRETANIDDGSAFCADMSVQNVIGDSFRGATWVALHNGGGTGFGQAINGGFGMFLDGSTKADENIQQMLYWDVINGVSRRSWSGNSNARQTVERAMTDEPKLKVTLPNDLSEECIKKLSL